jgi:hypothetical protein
LLIHARFIVAPIFVLLVVLLRVLVMVLLGLLGSAQIRLGQLTDFSFPFKNGGRFYLGVRAILTVTATASGLGTASSSANVLRQRQQRVVVLVAKPQQQSLSLFVLRQVRVLARLIRQVCILRHVLRRVLVQVRRRVLRRSFLFAPQQVRVSGQVLPSIWLSMFVPLQVQVLGHRYRWLVAWCLFAQPQVQVQGTQTAVGARVNRRTAVGSGTGTGTADWVKSHIFRVGITSDYSFAARYPETDSDRLFAHTPQGIRAYNLYKLTNNTYQITDPRRPELVAKIYYGGHDIFLDDTEVAELTAAGYGASIT